MFKAAQLNIQEDPFVRFKDQGHITGLGRTTVYSYIKQGFIPAPIKLGARACGWRLSTLREWLATRAESSQVATKQEGA